MGHYMYSYMCRYLYLHVCVECSHFAREALCYIQRTSQMKTEMSKGIISGTHAMVVEKHSNPQ